VAPASVSSRQAVLGQPVNLSSSVEETPEQSPPPAPRVRLLQRADSLATQVWQKAASVPRAIQDDMDAFGQSDAVACLVPVIVVAGFVVALVGGGGSPGCLGWSSPSGAN
jgi:hypothetical protein